MIRSITFSSFITFVFTLGYKNYFNCRHRSYIPGSSVHQNVVGVEGAPSIFIFGLGYVGEALARKLKLENWKA